MFTRISRSQHGRHLLRKFRVPTFHVAAYFVGLKLYLGQDSVKLGSAHLLQLRMTSSAAVSVYVRTQQTVRPQFLGIPRFLWILTGVVLKAMASSETRCGLPGRGNSTGAVSIPKLKRFWIQSTTVLRFTWACPRSLEKQMATGAFNCEQGIGATDRSPHLAAGSTSSRD